jgi:hypothetical protein
MSAGIPGVTSEVFLHEVLDEAVAVVVARAHPELEWLIRLGAGRGAAAKAFTPQGTRLAATIGANADPVLLGVAQGEGQGAVPTDRVTQDSPALPASSHSLRAVRCGERRRHVGATRAARPRSDPSTSAACDGPTDGSLASSSALPLRHRTAAGV